MNPAALAQRIAALDWSGCSLQHQLAVAAAVETLKAAPVYLDERCESPVTESGTAAFDAMVLPFPALRAPSAALLRGAEYTPARRVTLTRIDGRPPANALLARADRWDWIVETTCEICNCDAEQVACADDTVTVDGLPVLKLC